MSHFVFAFAAGNAIQFPSLEMPGYENSLKGIGRTRRVISGFKLARSPDDPPPAKKKPYRIAPRTRIPAPPPIIQMFFGENDGLGTEDIVCSLREATTGTCGEDRCTREDCFSTWRNSLTISAAD